MRHFGRSKSIWRRYFISYIAIFAIPLIILSVVLYNHTISELQNEVERYTLDKVTRMSNSLDDRLLETKKITLKISSDEAITPYATNLNDYRSKYAIDQLNRYWDKNFVDNLFVYFKDEDYIYNVNGKMSFNTMYTNVLGIDYNAGLNFSNIIKKMSSPMLLGIRGTPSSVSGTKDILVCLYPLPLGSTSHYGSVGIVINQSTVENIAGDIFGGSKGSIFIFNNEGHRIFVLGDKEFFPTDKINEFAGNNYPTGTSITTYNGSKLSVIKRISGTSGFRYVLVMSPESYLSRVITIRKQVFSVILVVIIAGVVLAFIFSAGNYQPIRILFEKVSKYASFNMDNSIGVDNNIALKKPDEIVSIEKMFDNIVEKNYGLREQLSYHKDFVKDQIILMLLKGQLNQKGNIDNLVDLYKMSFNYEYFFVSTISVKDVKESKITPSQLSLCINNIINEKKQNRDFYCVDTFQGDVVVLFNTSYENCSKIAIKGILKDIQTFLSDEFKMYPIE